jgi:hypothetical protein
MPAGNTSESSSFDDARTGAVDSAAIVIARDAGSDAAKDSANSTDEATTVITDAATDASPDSGCPEGQERCTDGICSVTGSCDACNRWCGTPGPHQMPVCYKPSGCSNECEMGYSDCNASLPIGKVDGCETHTFDNFNNCGSCGHRCQPGQRCYENRCF